MSTAPPKPSTTRTFNPKRNSQARVDPSAEFNRIRHSLSLLESYIYQPSRAPPQQLPATPSHSVIPRQQSAAYHAGESSREIDHLRSQVKVKTPSTNSGDGPGMLGQQGTAGYYAGPTSAVSHLITVRLAFALLEYTMFIMWSRSRRKRMRQGNRPDELLMNAAAETPLLLMMKYRES